MKGKSKIPKGVISSFGIALVMIFAIVTNAAGDPGEINLTKSAKRKDDYGRESTVSLSINANNYTTKKKLDVVLVLDGSSSMSNSVGGYSRETRLEAAKNSANTFITKLMDGQNDVQIGLVEFGTNVRDSLSLTSNKNSATNFINTKYDADGGTNLQEGIQKAHQLLNDGARSDAKQLVVILTDGVPTFFGPARFYSRRYNMYVPCGDGQTDSLTSHQAECNYQKPSEAAKNELDSLKTDYNQADVYTITFGDESEAAKILATVNGKNDNPLYDNYKALTELELTNLFDRILNQTIDTIGKGSVVTDTIPNTFKLTEEAKKKLESEGISYVENSDGTTTLTWNVGVIKANTNYELTYDVVAADDYHGSMYTNTSATLNTTVGVDNPKYGGKTDIKLDFNKPVTEVPIITKDDSYSGYENETVSGSILDNDLNKITETDKANNDDIVEVRDTLIIKETDSVVRNSDGTYNIYQDGVLQGVLTIDNSGKFDFVPANGITGEVKFDYSINTDVITNGKADRVYSNTSTVTITIKGKAKVSISGIKTWIDNNNQDGKRPDSIIINLLQNGKKIDSKEVTSDDNWHYEFVNLPKYANGHENESKYENKYTITEDEVTDYTTIIEGNNVINTHEIEKISIEGVKTWIDNDNQDGKRPESITVNLKANGKVITTKEVTAADGWKYSFTDLDKYSNGKEIEYTVSENAVKDYKTEINGYDITNTHEKELTEITVNKKWNDDNNRDGIRPDSIKVDLKANGKVVKTVTIKASDNWTYTFTNLDKYSNGEEINYTVEEKTITGYESEVNGYEIINTHEIAKTTIEGVKTWIDNDNQDGIRPDSIKISLKADGKVIATKEVTEKDEWKYSFTDLPVYENGKKINYTISEDKVASYTGVVSGYDITNTHKTETTTITVNKIWEDSSNNDGVRPDSIKINLYANGKLVKEGVVVTGNGDNWSYTFKDLPMNENGEKINYTVTEETVANYETSIDGLTITNTHEKELTEITVNKKWNDDNNRDGIRPDSIKVDLKANGKVVKTVTIKASDNWTYTFTNLDKYSNGEEINYTVEEKTITGYESEVNGYEITNTHEIAKTTIEGVKTWIDNDNQDGIRPDSIKISLKADGKVIATKEVTEKDEWKYSFTDLPVYENGKKINYTISEDKVASYTGVVSGYDITNTHKTETTTITVNKIWEDSSNNDGVRPDSIKINLYANGKLVKEGVVVTGNGDNWSYTFKDLPMNENGEKINYTVTEETVANYETSIDGLTITNNHQNEKISISGIKTWNDNNNQDGIRPDSIKVSLKANGKVIATKEVTAEDDWKYSFTNLDKYSNGEEIDYEITEEEVAGYTGVVNGYDITNTHNPIKTSLPVAKKWVDSNNQDGIRPDSIIIDLYADGTLLLDKTVTIKNTDNWNYTYTNLDKYSNGKEINYTVKEREVKDYTTTYEVTDNGINVINTHSPSKITINGTKTWTDNDNNDGLRPETITIRLSGKVGDNEVVNKMITVTEADDWKYSFTELPEYNDGSLISYTISEDAVIGYNTSIDGYNIVNSHADEEVTIEGVKTWIDNDNQDGIRPDSIKINLLADGEVVDSKIVTEKDNWKYSFTKNKYRNGKEINYTIEEVDVTTGYTATVTDYNVTNKHTPETLSYTVKKNWNDFNNNDGIRLDSIKVSIKANGVVKESITLSDENNWTYTFSDLPRYEKGKEIEYSIVEDEVKGYVSTLEEGILDSDNNITTVITNTHEIEKKEITITKTWVSDGTVYQPDEIVVSLYADGEYLYDITISKDMNWIYTLDNLPKYKNGKEINYTIKEKEVDGYTATYAGYNIINTMIPLEKGEIVPPMTGVNNNSNSLFELILFINTLLMGSILMRKALC